MVLSAKILTDVNSVNSFEFVERLQVVEGDAFSLYLQLADSSKGLRYVPAVGSTLTVVLDNIDANKKVSRSATQPYSGDGSIWSVSVLSSDPILAGTVHVKLTLVESGSTRKGIVLNAIAVNPKDI
jgi:hypothetical protein